MSLAENLLNSLGETRTASPEQEPHIIVGADRFIKVPDQLKKIAVTNDKDIETVHFDCVRYWDGYDLSTFAIYLNIALPNGEAITYIPKNITTSGNFYHFDWVVDGNVTKKSGTIGLGVTAIKTKTNENGDIVTDKRWSSFPNTDMSIVKGVDINNVPSEEESSDVIAQLSAILEEIQSNLGFDGVPNYVKTEAESVISRVIAAQKERTFTFAAISDLHYGNNGYTDGIKHACQAMKYIDKRIKLDSVAVLGDYTDGYPATGIANALGDFKEVNNLLDGLRFAPNMRQQGNHDYYANNIPVTHRFIQAYSDDVVWGDKLGGYYYKDFDDFKLRVISINTVEKDNANLACSVAQYQWFINSLDLSAKEDADEWQILILSHHPLDWYDADEVYSFAQIVDAYKNGTSWSNTTLGISCNYTNKNAATLIGNIHGHIHNFLVDYIHFGNVANQQLTNVWRMATPEACINRANQYTGEWAEDTTYAKVTGTVDDTSFIVYCVDLDTHTINAICYGAGYDRTLNYKDGTQKKTYSVTYNLTNVTVSPTNGDIEDVEEGACLEVEVIPNIGTSITSVIVTMGGVDVTETVYSDGLINIPEVTGNVVITAIADAQDEPDEPEAIINLLDTVGYTDGKRFSVSSGSEKDETGCFVTGYIDISDLDWEDSGDAFYGWGVDFNNANNDGKCVMVLYDTNKTVVGKGYLNPDSSINNVWCTFDDENILVITKHGTLDATYMRLSGYGSGANAVVTRNQLPS